MVKGLERRGCKVMVHIALFYACTSGYDDGVHKRYDDGIRFYACTSGYDEEV